LHHFLTFGGKGRRSAADQRFPVGAGKELFAGANSSVTFLTSINARGLLSARVLLPIRVHQKIHWGGAVCAICSQAWRDSDADMVVVSVARRQALKMLNCFAQGTRIMLIGMKPVPLCQEVAATIKVRNINCCVSLPNDLNIPIVLTRKKDVESHFNCWRCTGVHGYAATLENLNYFFGVKTADKALDFADYMDVVVGDVFRVKIGMDSILFEGLMMVRLP